jgi:choline dehydrogenase
MKDHGKQSVGKDGFSVHVCQLRPESRGRVTLASADPLADPAIFANYLATEEDRRALREGTKMVRALAAEPALKGIAGAEQFPGPDVTTDAQIDAWIRGAAETIYHPVGTCRMGRAGDAMAVVDAQLKVQALTGLRVIDASVMPTLVGGNTNAPTMMIAEKAADMILGRAPPAPLEVPVFEDTAAAAA